MIKAKFSTDKESGSICLEVTGHAGAAEKGKDLICASASILAYTVAQTLSFMYEEGKLHKKPRIRLEDGDILIRAKPKAAWYEETLHVFFVGQVGYHLLSSNFPQYVQLQHFVIDSEGC